MEDFRLAEESTVREAQIELIKKGMASLHPEEPSLHDSDFMALAAGMYDALTIKAQYWVGKYFREGQRLKEVEASNLKKIYQKPATIGEVTMIVHDLVNGEHGIKQGLDAWTAGINKQVALIGEALRMKGLLTAEDIQAAADSLVSKSDAEVAEIRKAFEELPTDPPLEQPPEPAVE